MKLFTRRLKCKYCKRSYWGANRWFFKHFEKKHPESKIACVELAP